METTGTSSASIWDDDNNIDNGSSMPSSKQARTGFREDPPSVVPSSQSFIAIHKSQTHDFQKRSYVPNPLLSSPFTKPLPTDEAHLRLQRAIQAQIKLEHVSSNATAAAAATAVAPNAPMMTASTGMNESIAVTSTEADIEATRRFITDAIPSALLEPNPIAAGVPALPNVAGSIDTKKEDMKNNNDVNEWEEIGALLELETPKQQSNDKINVAKLTISVEPTKVTSQLLPMPPIFSSPSSVEAVPISVSSSEKNFKMSSHASMLASAIDMSTHTDITTTCSTSKKDEAIKKKKKSPHQHTSVRIVSEKIEKVEDNIPSPQDLFTEMASKRGCSTKTYSAKDCGYNSQPSPLQLASFGTAVLKAAEAEDSQSLSALLNSGLSRNPCNSFSDYIICRSIKRGHVQSFKAQVDAGADLRIADDFGRCPLHFAAWSASPSFDVVDTLLKVDRDLIRLTDRLGKTPLAYVHESQRAKWNSYLSKNFDTFWPDKGAGWTEEDVPPLVERVGGMIADPDDAVSPEQASLIAMGKILLAADNKSINGAPESSPTKDSSAAMTTGTMAHIKRKQLDVASEEPSKKVARRASVSRKKMVASRCA